MHSGFLKEVINFLGDRHITINPMRKGRCTNPDADDYERAIAESSVFELIRAYKNPVCYWNTLTREQKREYSDDFSVFKDNYRKAVRAGMVVVLAALLLSVAFLLWVVSKTSIYKIMQGNYTGF